MAMVLVVGPEKVSTLWMRNYVFWKMLIVFFSGLIGGFGVSSCREVDAAEQGVACV